ncbi:MAG: ABC transporter ATP-binding protein [Cellulosilyticum sp.]|nr:ABC transporter ATP-binding protein [Cellulosilyticum sp.]
MSDYIVEMRHITKKFPGIIANKDVSLQVKKGEILAILGENGAGKSTLMSMLFGMYEPDEGEIYVRGEKVNITSPNEATKLNIGMVHQHFKLAQEYTITQNIVLGIEPVKRRWGFLPYVDLKEANEKVAKLSKQYGLEVDPTSKIKDISVSVQQRVEILKMLYRDAEILIFDEPTAVLTPQEIEFLLKIIKNLRDSGKTIILITHKLEEIKKVADRCVVLCRGELVDTCEVATTSTKEMARMMVGRDVKFELNKKEAEFGQEVLKVEHLTVKDSNQFEVVKDVSFSIREGEVFAIAGVSGNGQVEIADAIAGLVPAAGGKILLNGQEITKMDIRSRSEAGVAYIPEDRQAYGLVLDFTVAENAVLKDYYKPEFCEKGVLNKEAFESYSDKLIDKYDIRSGQGSKTQVRSMSGGNQQKIIIGREIELDAPLVIFVQPTRGLDIGAIERIHEQIIEERNKGKAILLISLELEEVMNCADTIGVIYNGEIKTIKEAKSLTTKEVGEYMMGVQA